MNAVGYYFGFYFKVLLFAVLLVCMINTNTLARGYFHVERPLLGLEFSYDFEEEKRTSSNQDSRSESQRFRERLNIETGGWVYHPGLWQYNLRIMPEWIQETREFDSEEESRNALVEGYFFNSTLLPYKPYTLSLFGERKNIPATGAFGTTSDMEIDRYGASLGLKNRVLPTSASYRHEEKVQRGFYTSTMQNEEWRLSSSANSPNSVTNLNSGYDQKVSSYEGTSDSETRSFNGSLTNNYIRDDLNLRLTSSAGYRFTESDGLESSVTDFSENIGVRHATNLESRYHLKYSRSESGDFFNENKGIGAGLSHRLYENLVTSVSGNVDQNRYSGGRQDLYIADLLLDYGRKIPWGHLRFYLGHSYRYRSSVTSDELIPIIDEPHVLTGFEITLLDKENVDRDSIRVTDATGALYFEDIDYTVQVVGSLAGISRRIGSGIADREQVKVSYNYAADPSLNEQILGQSYGVSIDLWSALRLSYQYQRSRQDVISGTPPETLEDDTTHTASISFNYGFNETELAYENVERSSGITTEIWRLSETLTFRPLSWLFLRFSGGYSRWEFEGNDIVETQEAFSQGGSVNWTPKSWCRFSLGGTRYSVRGDEVDSEDMAVTASAELFYQIWRGRLTYTVLDEKDRRENETRQVNRIGFELIKINF